MDILTITLLIVILSVILIMLGVPIAYSLGFCSVIGILLGVGEASLVKLGLAPFSLFHGLNWIPLPLFLLMAFIIGETDIGKGIFDAANKWLSFVPGGLVVSGIFAEAAMAATMGVSGTTLLTVCTVALPEMERLGYNKEFSMSALLTGGVLGPLIPPSVPLIVFAVISQQSISQLFMAGVIPGILLALMLSTAAMLICYRHPEYAPRPSGVSWSEKLNSLKKVWPILILMLGILGGIYSGAVTATEAGAVGVIITLLISILLYNFRLPQFIKAISQTSTLTGMVSLMIIATTIFSFVVGVSGLAQNLSNVIVGLGLSPLLVIITINLAILFLGCIMDGLAILMVTMPLFLPIVTHLGFDPIWFGILVTVNIEIALITPPVGLNLFLVSGIFRIPVALLIKNVAPFLALLIIYLGVLIAFPQISLWLPGLLRG